MLQKIIIAVLALSALFTGSTAFAQTSSTTPPSKPLPVIFPIAELGGCTSKDACKAYCDVSANHDACFAYAQTHGLMTRDQITLAKKLQAAVGPGGCQGEECKNYCEDGAHAQVCITFAQQNGFISKDDADKRLQFMRFSSTTRPLPSIPVNSTGTVASSTQLRPHSDIRPANTTKPPPHREASSTGQSSSVFFSILHFFGL